MKARQRTLLSITAVVASLLGGAPRVADAQPGQYIASNGWTNFSGPSFSFTRTTNTGQNWSDYVAMTYYFYWYDDAFTGSNAGQYLFTVDTGATHYDVTGLHPLYVFPNPVPPQGLGYRTWGSVQATFDFSWTSVAWHQNELQQMAAAGLDMVLPDYWGTGSGSDAGLWYNAGLVNLDQAAANLGQASPKIGMFYDTNTLLGLGANNLASATSKQTFYQTIRDFYSRVNPSRWGRYNNGAVVCLFSANPTLQPAVPFTSDGTLFSYCRQKFAQDFGGSGLFFVGDLGWESIGLTPDMIYQWGASGYKNHMLSSQQNAAFDVNEVGAQFNNTANYAVGVAQRGGKPGGAIIPCSFADYTQAWATVNAGQRRVIGVETWNELLESTGILPSQEFGYNYYNIAIQGINTHHFNGDIVKQAYLWQLGRPVDSLGFSYDTVGLDQGRSAPSSLRDNLLNSTEAANRLPNTNYVIYLYYRYLRRSAAQSELNSWVNALQAGSYTRSQARDIFVSSGEAQADISNSQFVTNLFVQFLNRQPDSPGYNSYMTLLANGTPRSQVRDYFINAYEFTQQKLTTLTGNQQQNIFEYAGY